MTTKEFLKLPKKARAVIIAKDVLKQLKLGVYEPDNFYGTCPVRTSQKHKLDEGADAASFLNDKNSPIHCEGCARASLFLSAIKFKNELNIGEVINARFDYPGANEWTESEWELGTRYLYDEFSCYQQAIIESAYEGDVFGSELEYKMDRKQLAKFEKDRETAIIFHNKETKKWVAKKGQKGRPSENSWILQAIMRNIIRNEGVFKP